MQWRIKRRSSNCLFIKLVNNFIKLPYPIIFFFFLTHILLQNTAQAQWQPNGVAICDTIANAGVDMLPRIASDLDGGAFICWKDARSGTDNDIYMQHIFSYGTMQFPHNGVPLCNAPESQQFQRIISDEKGGAFIAWEDNRSGTTTDIYAQHINKQGKKLWDNQGIKVAEYGGLFINIASDDKGGLLVGWVSGGVHDVVIQYLDSIGSRIWGDSGVQVTNRPGNVYSNDVAVVTDGYGGAFVGWSEELVIYIQRVDSLGQIVFATNGIALTNNSLRNIDVSISSDTQGGAIISWSSLVSAGSLDTSYKYAQRVSATGDLLWEPGGVRIGTIKGGGARRHTSDGEGEAYIGHGRWIQHISVEGELSWQGEGAPYTLRPSVFSNSSQTRNGSKGIWNFWSQDTGGFSSLDIYGQYIDSSGNVSWESNGKPICIVEHLQDWAKAASVNDGTAIVVWMDYRNNRTNVFAAKVDAEGIITRVEDQGEMLPSTPYLEQNYPNPFNSTTNIHFYLPREDVISLTVYDILGNEIVKAINNQSLNRGWHNYQLNINTFGENQDGISSGVYLYKLKTSGGFLSNKMIYLK